MTLPAVDALAVEVVEAIRGGQVGRLRALLDANPKLAGAQIADVGCDDTRSLLHIATDWPGHFPNGPEVVRTLVAAGSHVTLAAEATSARRRCTGRQAATTSR